MSLNKVDKLGQVTRRGSQTEKKKKKEKDPRNELGKARHENPESTLELTSFVFPGLRTAGLQRNFHLLWTTAWPKGDTNMAPQAGDTPAGQDETLPKSRVKGHRGTRIKAGCGSDRPGTAVAYCPI